MSLTFADGGVVSLNSRRKYKLLRSFVHAERLIDGTVGGATSTDSVRLHATQSTQAQIDIAKRDLKDGPEKTQYIRCLETSMLANARKAPHVRMLPTDRQGISRTSDNYFQRVGLPNVGNSCFLNTVLQVIASLRVLHVPLPGETTDVIYQLASPASQAPKLLQLICEQLVAMRYPDQHNVRKRQLARLTKISNGFAERVMKTGVSYSSQQDASEVVLLFLKMACEHYKSFSKVTDFGMVILNDTTLEERYEATSSTMLSVAEYAHAYLPRKSSPSSIMRLCG